MPSQSIQLTPKSFVSAWKEIWKGGLQAIGALAVAALASRLAAWIPPVRHWTADQIGSLVAPGRVDLTVFLAFLALCLLALFIASRITLYRLRRRVAENRLTLGDMAGGKRGLQKGIDEFEQKV
jgi:hypothetical protein